MESIWGFPWDSEVSIGKKIYAQRYLPGGDMKSLEYGLVGLKYIPQLPYRTNLSGQNFRKSN